MRIDSLEIRNFKIIRHLKLDNVPDLVVIAGPNGSGKTALFDALRIFKEAVATYSMRSQGPIYVQNLLQQIGLVITAGEAEAKIAVSLRVSEAERRAIGMPENHPGLLYSTVKVYKPDLGQQEVAQRDYGAQDAHEPDSDWQLLQRLFSQYRSGGELGVIDHIGPDRRFMVPQMATITFSPDNEEIELQRLVYNSQEKFSTLTQDIVMMDLRDRKEERDNIEEPHYYMDGVRQIFQHFLPDQDFVGVHVPNLSSLPQILVRSGGVEHDISQLSSGQREILMTYTHLEKLRPTGSIVFFDEPELHLHPTLQRRVIDHLRRLVYRGENQIWAITQSEEIVDTTEYESLFAMTGEGDPAIERVRERAEQIELLRHLGANIGLQLTSPRILFVEGDTDAELLPRLYGTLPASVSIVSTGGKGNLMRLTPAAMNLLDEAIKEGQFFFIRDRDMDDPTVLDDLEKKHKGYFFTWDRYHIENYLLDGEAIRSVLSDPDIPGDPASAQEIDRQLRVLADERKCDVLARHLEAKLNPTLRRRLILNVPEGVKGSLLKAATSRQRQINELLEPTAVEQMYSKVESEIEAQWDTQWKKFCVGRDILQAFHQEYVKGFDYEVFRNKVARKIHELNRIPETINKVMTAVTADLPTIRDTGSVQLLVRVGAPRSQNRTINSSC